MNSDNKRAKVSNKQLLFFLEIFLFDACVDTLTLLTKYPPFSLLSDNYVFHHNNIKVITIKKLIRKIYFVPTMYQDRDQYYFYLYYDKRYMQIEKLKKFLKNEDVLINESGDFIKILIPR